MNAINVFEKVSYCRALLSLAFSTCFIWVSTAILRKSQRCGLYVRHARASIQCLLLMLGPACCFGFQISHAHTHTAPTTHTHTDSVTRISYFPLQYSQISLFHKFTASTASSLNCEDGKAFPLNYEYYAYSWINSDSNNNSSNNYNNIEWSYMNHKQGVPQKEGN